MTCIITISYPSTTKFNLSYYRSTHMPLVQRKWQPYGLKDWYVCTLDEDAPYKIQCSMFWESEEHFEKAVKEASEEIMEDVANFADEKPVRMVGKVVAQA